MRDWRLHIFVLSDFSIKCIRSKPRPAHGLPCGDLAAPPAGNDIVKVVRQRLRRAAVVSALRLGEGDALALALEDVIPLEFGDSREHGQHEFSCRGGGVDRLLFGHELDFLDGQLFDQLEQVAGVARKAADRLDDHRVPFADIGQHAFELRAVGVLAARPVEKNLVHAELTQQRLLSGGVLLFRADADIADVHTAASFLILPERQKKPAGKSGRFYLIIYGAVSRCSAGAFLAGRQAARLGIGQRGRCGVFARAAGFVMIALARGRDVHGRRDAVVLPARVDRGGRFAGCGGRGRRAGCAWRRRCARRRGGGRLEGGCALVRRQAAGLTVGHGDDRTVEIGAPDRDAGQLLQRRGARVAVAVARAAADDRGVRRDGGEERAAGRGARAVVADLEHIALDVRARRQDGGLDLGFRVAHEQERGILIGRPEDDRNIVQVVRLLRGDDRNRCIAQLEGLACGRHGHRDVFRLDRVEYIGVGLRGGRRAGQQHLVDVQIEDDVVYAADVVGVRVRTDDVFEFIRADLAQIAHDVIAVRVVARVDQHVFAVAR